MLDSCIQFMTIISEQLKKLMLIVTNTSKNSSGEQYQMDLKLRFAWLQSRFFSKQTH